MVVGVSIEKISYNIDDFVFIIISIGFGSYRPGVKVIPSGKWKSKNDSYNSWSNPADITYGTPLSGTQLNAVASANGTQ